MYKTRVAVLRGGPSTEHEVSMLTGAGVLKALVDDGYFTKDIVVTKAGEWLHQGFVKQPHKVLADIDVVFIALHGTYGEDGQAQRILQNVGVPYTGSGPYSSGVAMNKALTKGVLQSLDVRMPKHMKLSRDNIFNVARTTQSIAELFGPEYVIKPIAGGSSIGTIMVPNASALGAAIEDIFQTHQEILVEERIKGREATAGILERYRNQKYYQLPVVEIVPHANTGFFDATVKYDGSTEEICPGRFSKTQKIELSQIAQRVHEALGLSHYSRSDFMVTDSGIYFLEVNSLPGLTPQSLFPRSIEAIGSNYNELIRHLVTIAMETKR